MIHYHNNKNNKIIDNKAQANQANLYFSQINFQSIINHYTAAIKII